jgi:hypothetical protein
VCAVLESVNDNTLISDVFSSDGRTLLYRQIAQRGRFPRRVWPTRAQAESALNAKFKRSQYTVVQAEDGFWDVVKVQG